MRGVLGARGSRVLKLVEGLFDVCGHVNVTYALVVVPVDGDTVIEGTNLSMAQPSNMLTSPTIPPYCLPN